MAGNPVQLGVAEPFPYVVVRWIPGAYGRRDVVFTTEPQGITTPRLAGPIHVPEAEPYVEGELTARARQAIIDRVQASSTETQLRMCCVFGPDDAVYVEPEGQAARSRTPPSGGVRFDEVEVVGEPRRRR